MARDRHGSRDWNPAYPDIAVTPEEGLYDSASHGGAPYESAPSTSHVYGWKLLEGGFVSRMYGPAVGAPSGTKAVLMVAFKPNPPKGSQDHPNAIKSEYEYYFTDVGEARGFLEDFRAAQHPGHVVQELIRRQVPYKRKS